MNTGTIIRQLRQEKGLSQLTLGLLIGNDSAYISRIESGKKEPTLKTIVRIAEALEVEPLKMLEMILNKN